MSGFGSLKSFMCEGCGGNNDVRIKATPETCVACSPDKEWRLETLKNLHHRFTEQYMNNEYRYLLKVRRVTGEVIDGHDGGYDPSNLFRVQAAMAILTRMHEPIEDIARRIAELEGDHS